LDCCSVHEEFKDTVFQPTQQENDFNTFMFNMKGLNCRKFTEAVLCVAQPRAELELMDLDSNSDSDSDPGE